MQASRYFDFEVVDASGGRVGTVEAVWEDERTGRTEFLGVRTTWLVGRIHLVPADMARVDEATRTVALPWTEAQVRGAPDFDPSDPVSPEQEAGIYAHFGRAATAQPPGSGAVPAGERATAEPHVHRAFRHEEHLGFPAREPPRH